MCGSHLVHCGLLLRNLKQKRQVILLAQWPKHCPLIVETRSQTQRKGVKFAHLDLLLWGWPTRLSGPIKCRSQHISTRCLYTWPIACMFIFNSGNRCFRSFPGGSSAGSFCCSQRACSGSAPYRIPGCKLGICLGGSKWKNCGEVLFAPTASVIYQ